MDTPIAEALTARAASAMTARKALAIAFSLTSLMLIEIWQNVYQIRTPQALYFNTERWTPPTLEVSALLNLGVLTLLLFLLVWLRIVLPQRAGRRPAYRLPASAGALMLWQFASFALIQWVLPLLTPRGRSLVDQGTAVVSFLIFTQFGLPAIIAPALFYWPERCWSVVQAVALVFFPFAVLCTARTAWQGLHPPDLGNRDAILAASTPISAKPLVLWVIFDEMDQSATFRNTLGDLGLRNLNALREVSFSGDHACQVADLTARAIPSYTTGKHVRTIRWDSPQDLLLAFEASSKLEPWTRQHTVFHDAAAGGRRTALLGYFHPYCRLFANVAEHCEVFPYFEGGYLMRFWGTLQNLPLHEAMWLEVDRSLPVPAVAQAADGRRCKMSEAIMYRVSRERHDRIVENMRDSVLRVISNPAIDFVFFHVPLPHPPALSTTLGPESAPLAQPGYARDLQTADRLVGQIRTVLERSGRWHSSAVVVTSDHTVREWWSDNPFASPSLLQAARARTDDTVPFLIKTPYQTQPVRYAKPFSAILAHGLVQRLLTGEIRLPAQVLEYVQRNSSPIACPATGVDASGLQAQSTRSPDEILR